MERFLNQDVIIHMCLGGVDGCGTAYKGFVTSFDDEFICLDDKTFVARKYILAIKLR